MLGFTAQGDLFQKSIGDAELKVDFQNGQIVYPEYRGLIVNERQTCNFSRNENFVVFECVHRLLEKGYKPEHLELEPKWRLGRGASGGRADILIKDHEYKPLLLFECKTPGAEFNSAWTKTTQDGDQLFSYAQQIAEVKYLCLYASDLIENEIWIDQRIISHCDNDEILEQNAKLLSFASVTDVKDRYAVWRDTYELEYTESGIFEENIQAYQIGKSNYTLSEDTKAIDAVDKERKYHDFRTILRKHNIARRENAFEVLVNLFLCKLVDEEENKTDLKFYWKGIASDNYFDFVDRLQDLYQKGMRKYLNEEISYISNEQIDSAFWTIKNKRNATKKQIQAYFRELKFFTNSAFSFLDTHNENLFTKNAKVLLEIVQMWQGTKLKTDRPNQFLGDMFEYFLDNSIKQSEGQFFTPLPICKFIVASLPLSQMIVHGSEPIKAIDFACGAGHFLTEYAHQIAPLVKAQGANPSDYYAQIIGVEKEDRLAKVAKVAAYMYGQEQIKILDADALASHHEISLADFDMLVANPPFAVEGFLQTLTDEDKKQYQLIGTTGQNSNTNSIQCFFIERIHHLLAPGGVVGVIVPSSILSNPDAVNVHTREIILQFFDIVSIAELGSGTFGKTGTNTVVLFLRRKTQNPEAAEHYSNRVDDYFEGDTERNEYQDDHLIHAYCSHIGVPHEEYIKLFTQSSLYPLSTLLQYDIFKAYKREFEESTATKKRKESNMFKKKTETEQLNELESRFITYLHSIEKDKLLYFILAHEQENSVVIVNAPTSNQERKHFLGYEWSGAKGSEGIKYIGGKTVNDIATPLFDPQHLNNDTKINTAIKSNFIGKTADALPEHCRYVKLTEMLDFGRTTFNKEITLNPIHNSDIESKWTLAKLGEVAEIVAGQSPKSQFYNANEQGLPFYQGKKEFGNRYLSKPSTWTEQVTKQSIRNDILMSVRAPVGNVNLNPFDRICIGRGLAAIRAKEGLLQLYLYHFLYNNQSSLTGHKGMSFDSISTTEELPEIKIPLPWLDVQKYIVDQCEAVDHQVDQAHQNIANDRQAIEQELRSVARSGYEMKTIAAVLTLEYGISLPEKKRTPGDFPVYGSNGVVGTHDQFLVDAPCIIVGRKGSAGKINWSHKNCTPIDTTFYVKLNDANSTDLKFTYHMLRLLNLPSLKSGSGPGGINRNNVYQLHIPVPPLTIQHQLVLKIDELEEGITQAQAVIESASERKAEIMKNYL